MVTPEIGEIYSQDWQTLIEFAPAKFRIWNQRSREFIDGTLITYHNPQSGRTFVYHPGLEFGFVGVLDENLNKKPSDRNILVSNFNPV